MKNLETVIVEKWTAALRSGEYHQIRGQAINGPRGRCAMGVLHDVSLAVGLDFETATFIIRRKLGANYEKVVIVMNDKAGLNFHEIANRIEERCSEKSFQEASREQTWGLSVVPEWEELVQEVQLPKATELKMDPMKNYNPMDWFVLPVHPTPKEPELISETPTEQSSSETSILVEAA